MKHLDSSPHLTQIPRRPSRILQTHFYPNSSKNEAVDVLDEAISLHRELLILRPPGHRYRKSVIKGLVQLLVKRREATGDDRDCREVRDLEVELAA